MKKIFVLLGIAVFSISMVTGCGGNTGDTGNSGNTEVSSELADAETTIAEDTEVDAEPDTSLADGEYQVAFDTDSSMFHVNEACDGKGTLTVENGKMTIHISLVSQNIVNLYCGLAADAEAASKEELLWPSVDTVTYSDGTTEEVYGYDVPVNVLDQEFDLAILGKKGTWYDHKVSVASPELSGEVNSMELSDGTYSIEVSLEGGSGKATVTSPCMLQVEEGKIYAEIEWSSSHYDYMLVDGEKYLPVNAEGNSVFRIPVSAFDTPLDVVGDTTAMSTPHEVEYTLNFDSATLTEVSNE